MSTNPGICITWYDLAGAHRDSYLNWLHGTYLPALVRQPGINWAAHYRADDRGVPARLTNTTDRSIPSGGDYILLVGADTAHRFASPRPGETFAPIVDGQAAMLGRRLQQRASVMVEERVVKGPVADESGGAPGPCIQLGSFNAALEDEDELLSWYARWRLPCMEALPGSIRTRKLAGILGWSKHGILYEFSSLKARDDNFPNHEKVNPALEKWTDKVVRRLVHAPRSPQIGHRIWPAADESGVSTD